MPKNRRQIIASARENTLMVASARLTSRSRIIRAVEMSSNNGSSLDTVALVILIGLMTDAMPIKSSTLIILLPITLPIRISVLPLIMDEKETASSGAPVPKAIMVSPIRSFDTLKCEAVDEAPSTSQSAPLIKSMKPMINRMICNNIFLF